MGNVMFDLKSLSELSIEAALEKAVRYRLLNESEDAESICRDVLEIDPDNQSALVTLLLALTDQFDDYVAGKCPAAREIAARLQSEYEREYYAGIINERRAKAIRHRSTPGWGCVAFEWLSRAMECYERAEELRPKDNDEAILRWNSCARFIMADSTIKADESQSSPIESE
jgi:tetratricopeptide (TPR) repeat protein